MWRKSSNSALHVNKAEKIKIFTGHRRFIQSISEIREFAGCMTLE